MTNKLKFVVELFPDTVAHYQQVIKNEGENQSMHDFLSDLLELWAGFEGTSRTIDGDEEIPF